MVRITPDLRAAAPVRTGDDSASDTAIGAGGADHGSFGPRASRALLIMSARDARGPKDSVHIALVAAGLGEAVEPGLGAGTLAALLGRNLQQRVLDVLGHALGIAADIEVRAFLQPAPELGRVLAQAVLDVDLLGLVAREGEIEVGQHAAALPVEDLVLVEKIRGAFLIAEEQPVPALGAARLALLEKSPKRGNTGAGSDHDGRSIVVGRRREAVALLHEHRHDVARLGEIGEIAGTDAGALPVVAVPAHGRHGEMDLAW